MATNDSLSSSVRHVAFGRTARGIRAYGMWHSSVRHVVYDSKKGGMTEMLCISCMNHRHNACHEKADDACLPPLHDIL